MPPKTKTLKPQTFTNTIVPLLKTQQFYWYVGHVSVLFSFVMYTVKSFFSSSLFYYKLTLLSVLLTYTIVLRQVHFKTLDSIKSPTFKQNLLKDENFHYFWLALTFFLVSGSVGAVSGALYSFTIFSLFHALTYFQNNILGALPTSLSQQQAINSRINTFTTSYNEPALMVAANAELLLLSSFVFTIPFTPFRLFRAPVAAIANLWLFATVVVFLKLRYDSNKYTRTVVDSWDLRISQFLYSPQSQIIPQGVKDAYLVHFKGALQKYLGPITFSKTVAPTKKNK
ncbi:pore membrane protein of 33 kDa [[Candida] anglica]|uniref:Pore membrane protein of 33 kDa n=1 Tax=[Candida] anglica TaxID=148631 RepID=A0ABP0EDI6_9ASCO